MNVDLLDRELAAALEAIPEIDIWANLVARSIYAAGGRPKDKVHISYGYGLFTGGLGVHYGAERLGAAVVPISGGNTNNSNLTLNSNSTASKGSIICLDELNISSNCDCDLLK
jgi:hypothetical protein